MVAALWEKKPQSFNQNIPFVIPKDSVNGYKDFNSAL